jgi:multidrug resistance efflux pump
LTGSCPKLRPDLVVSQHRTREGACYVLKDPLSLRFFRLGKAEYSVARRLDGVTPPEIVARAVAVELEAEAAPDVVAAFIEQLRRGGLLVGTGTSPAAIARPPLVRGSLLWLRFRAFDPDRLLDRLIGKVSFCFTPQFMVAASALILWAFFTVLARGGEVRADMTRLWNLQALALAWITVIAVTTLHEFAHGLTCKRFGGHVHEMGFLLIYLQPAFYCNISDAWLFPVKSQRLWVTFAGSFFELFLWALATLVWRLTEPGTWVCSAALIVMATSGVKLFLNFNPLIKLDGYYFLSDWLEIPNLRRRAFAHVGARLKRLAGAVSALPVATLRERRVFLAYGLIAATFSYWVLTNVLIRLGGYFTHRWHGWGAMLWSGLFLGVIRNVKGKPVLRWPRALSFRSHRLRILVLLAALAALLHFLPLELRVGGAVEVAPARNTEVRAQVQGIIDAVFVDEGSRVAAGDTLARLADREDRARLDMVEAEVAEKQAKLRLLELGPRAEERDVARLAVAGTEERLRYARAEFDRIHQLAASQAVPRKEEEAAQQAVGALANQLEGEQARSKMLDAGTRPEEIAAMREQLANSEAEERHLEEQMARSWVVAPHGGVVVTPKLREHLGQQVKPGDLIAQIDAVETVTAEIAVPEQDIGDVRVGQRSGVRLRAYPERAFEGRVIAIAPIAIDRPGQDSRVVRVTVEFPNTSGLVKPSMTGYARIQCGTRSALDVLTRPLRSLFRVEVWSWW